MTEDEAKAWLNDIQGVSRETFERLEDFVGMVTRESRNQNLISAASLEHIWARHVVDSAQLLPLKSARNSDENLPWLDLGTGAGFPGIIIAILSPQPMILVESRRKRFAFLADAAEMLALPHVTVHGGALESLGDCGVGAISARAFAPLPKLLDLAHRFSRKKTVWLLPKGRSVQQELASIETSWQGLFHVEQSLTDAGSDILIAQQVQRRKEAT